MKQTLMVKAEGSVLLVTIPDEDGDERHAIKYSMGRVHAELRNVGHAFIVRGHRQYSGIRMPAYRMAP